MDGVLLYTRYHTTPSCVSIYLHNTKRPAQKEPGIDTAIVVLTIDKHKSQNYYFRALFVPTHLRLFRNIRNVLKILFFLDHDI